MFRILVNIMRNVWNAQNTGEYKVEYIEWSENQSMSKEYIECPENTCNYKEECIECSEDM